MPCLISTALLLRVRSTSNNPNGNKRVIFFPVCIAWCYGDNDFIVRTFDFVAQSDAARVTCSTDMDSRVTCSADTDSCVTCSADTDSCVTCSADTDSHVTCSADTDSRVTCSADTDSRVTCSADTDSHVTCVKNTAFYKLRAASRLPH